MEKPAPTGQHHRFVDISDGARGVALFSRGLPEHEVVRDDGQATALALTLLRSVGWLSRGDLGGDRLGGRSDPADAVGAGARRAPLRLRDHACTPGDWQAGGVMAEARRFAAPPLAVTLKGRHTAPAARALVEVTPDEVTLTGVHPAETGRGTVVRVVNNSAQRREATLRLGFPAREAMVVDPLEREVDGRIACSDSICKVPLGPWQIATVLFRS